MAAAASSCVSSTRAEGSPTYPAPREGLPGQVASQQMSAVAAARSFRPDIEGLRALAVLGVIAFHFGATGLPGGFVGVDIFFVISGYLITKHLQQEIARRVAVDLWAFAAHELQARAR
jgi:peptidoglycan/LPS O-acetylase OafA/YrhL